MSGGLDCLAITEDDITKMLAATTHIGSDNSETTMEVSISYEYGSNDEV